MSCIETFFFVAKWENLPKKKNTDWHWDNIDI